jgi:hypothetical protein
LAADAANQSAPIYDIATGSSPALASDSQGHLHVVFEGKEPDKSVVDIFYAESSDDGKTWTSPKDVSGTPGQSSQPDIAVEKDGGIDVVWTDTTAGENTPDIYFARSADGGKTWTAAKDISTTPGSSTEPAVATGPDNSIHIVWSDTSKGEKNRDIYYCCSTDGGKTFAKDPLLPAVDISNTPGNSSEPTIAVGQLGTVHVAWLDSTPGASRPDVIYLQNQGGTWTNLTNVSHSSRISSHPSLACGPKSKVLITWSDNSRKENAADIWFEATQTPLHFAKARPINISNSPGVSSQPSIAADEKGRLAIVWSDTSSGEKSPDIFARISDGGSEFTNVLDVSNTPGVSKHPDVTISGSHMFVVWQDVNVEGTKSTIKVTSMDINNVPTGPAQDVDPVLQKRH